MSPSTSAARTFTPVAVSSSCMVLTNDINTIIVTSAMDIAAITAAIHEITVIFVPILIDLFNVKMHPFIYNISSV